MDGRSGKVVLSLQTRLSVWIVTALLGFGVIFGGVTYKTVFHEANELQDDQLRQIAALINRHNFLPNKAGSLENVPHTDPQSTVIVEALPSSAGRGEVILNMPGTVEPGMHTIIVRGVAWRVFVRRLDSGVIIAVGQKTALRDESARESALLTLLPFALLVPVLLLLLSRLIHHLMKPIRQQAMLLDGRLDVELSPIDDQGMPSELLPFTKAINQLFARTNRLLHMQQQFIADAAHELRSPLTAFALQLERLESADLSADSRQKVDALQRGMARMQGLLEQLLAMTLSKEPPTIRKAEVSVCEMLKNVLEDLMPLVEQKSLDLEIVASDNAKVCAIETDIRMLIKNLVENAVRYTPEGKRIEISISSGSGLIVFQIDDSGPGISEGDRERVFEPFYRVIGTEEAGAGLGLAIVKTIVTRLHASIVLTVPEPGSRCIGLRVVVSIPTTRNGDINAK